MDGLSVGQIVKTMGRQITVPTWHEVWKDERFEKVGAKPCIRISFQDINTNSWNQSGLVCFVPEKYLGMAILSVKIKSLHTSSCVAEPLEWIEVNPKLEYSHIGETANTIFSEYCSISANEKERTHLFMVDSINRDEVRAIWHNKDNETQDE